jgi:hypothetical protein
VQDVNYNSKWLNCQCLLMAFRTQPFLFHFCQYVGRVIRKLACFLLWH